jgi:Na+-translocating ferredoxin:NAD+ oxidoreductase RnfA subunit
MTHGNLVGISLAVILFERFVLDRRTGKTPISPTSTKLRQRAIDAGVVLALLIIGAIGSWLLALFVLAPCGVVSCSLLAFIIVIVGASMGIEAIVATWLPFDMLNRIITRAAVLSSILGTIAFLPWWCDSPGHAASFLHCIKAAVLTGASFAAVRMAFDGVMERAADCEENKPDVRLARELAAAALVALALAGISTISGIR